VAPDGANLLRGGFSYFRHHHRLAFLILSEKGGERRYSYNGGFQLYMRLAEGGSRVHRYTRSRSL
jgi:hypothetical protein